MKNNLLALSAKEGRWLRTTDFKKLIQAYFDTSRTHYGVILPFRRPLQEIAQRLLVILNQVTADEMENQVRYI